MSEQTSYVLAINGGSSSLKFGLFQDRTGWMELEGHIEKIGANNGHFTVRDVNGQILEDLKMDYPDAAAALQGMTGWLKDRAGIYPVTSIGHRLVQGGPDHQLRGFAGLS
jgi:acetate kinase